MQDLLVRTAGPTTGILRNMSVNQRWSRPTRVVVSADTDDEPLREAAQVLAQELNLPLLDAPSLPGVGEGVRLPARRDTLLGSCDTPADTPDLVLTVCKNRLELRETCRGATGSVFVDFVRGPVGYRRKFGLSRRQPIALAVGLRRGPTTVLDATAGLARDSFLLACLGCTVMAVERSPVLGALVRDGLKRAAVAGASDLRDVLERITLIVDDARDVLTRMAGTAAPDVVYLDPMYPPTVKTALAKKEMRICRRLVGDDPDAGELLMVARKVAKRRVVVKRHRRAPPLAPRPAIQYLGKQVRYDVYHPQT